MLMRKNNSRARDGAFSGFRWAETSLPLSGNKIFANQKKIMRPSAMFQSLKKLAGYWKILYLCSAFRDALRIKAASRGSRGENSRANERRVKLA